MKEVKTPILGISIPIILIVILAVIGIIFVILNPFSLILAIPFIGLGCLCSPIIIIVLVMLVVIYLLFIRKKEG